MAKLVSEAAVIREPEDGVDQTVGQSRALEFDTVGVEDGCGVAEIFDQLFRVGGTDTTYTGQGELIEGMIFHGRFRIILAR